MISSKKELFLDIETFSDRDIKSTGAYKYIASDAFEIILLAYAWGDEPVKVLEPSALQDKNNKVVVEILEALKDPSITKIAHNAVFERTALGKYAGGFMPINEWKDTMVLAAMQGLPLSLDAVGEALNLTDKKIKEGTLLINYFCKPCKATRSNGMRTRNLPEHDLDRWERFKSYCIRDVEVCREIYRRLSNFPIPAWEEEVRRVDDLINLRGVKVSTALAKAAVEMGEKEKEANLAEMARLTGLDNPNSVAQLKSWLEDEGYEVESLNKESIKELLSEDIPETVRRVLELRTLIGKTSNKKYQAMLDAAGDDDRVRGLLQYYGTRTGRWAGRLVQVQNLPQNHLDDIGEVRDLVLDGDLETLKLLYESVPDMLSQLIRTAFVAEEGHRFLIADYSAIEARITAYLAGEQWRLDTFAAGGDIYCQSATQMFKVPVEKHGINGHLRAKGKIAELACGYGGGVGALKAFGADKMGLSESDMQEIVDQWRAASPTIPKLWSRVEKAAKQALENPGRKVGVSRKKLDKDRARANELAMGAVSGSYSAYFNDGIVCTFYRDRDALRCKLPSGRVLSYRSARLEDGSIVFMGQNQTTKKWEKMETWGGRLVENIVQSFARDCLAVAMVRLSDAGFKPVFSVHDEVIAEEPKDGRTWRDMAKIMSQPIDWAPGLVLPADGFETDFYMKD